MNNTIAHTLTNQPIYCREYPRPLPSGDRGKWMPDYATRLEIHPDGSATITINGGRFRAAADAWKLRQ